MVKKNSNKIVESNPINDYHRTLNLIIIGYHSIIWIEYSKLDIDRLTHMYKHTRDFQHTHKSMERWIDGCTNWQTNKQ